jgi:hypothetical protein
MVVYATETTIYTAVTAQTAAVRFKKTTVKSIKPNLPNRCQRFTARFLRFTARFFSSNRPLIPRLKKPCLAQAYTPAVADSAFAEIRQTLESADVM